MLSFLFGLFFSPTSLILGILASVAALLVGKFFGWKLVTSFLSNTKVWLVVVTALVVLSFSHMDKKTAALEAKVAQQQTQAVTDKDAVATTDLRLEQKDIRKKQTERLKKSINNAEPGQAQDDLLDQIAKDRPDLNSPNPDGVRKRVDGSINP